MTTFVPDHGNGETFHGEWTFEPLDVPPPLANQPFRNERHEIRVSHKFWNQHERSRRHNDIALMPKCGQNVVHRGLEGAAAKGNHYMIELRKFLD